MLAGTVAAIRELGYEHTTVTQITRCAAVSRRTFYELFANREECAVAVLQNAASELRKELEAQGLSECSWRERMRQGLWTILCFLERDPVLALVVVVDTQCGGGLVLAARQAIIRQLVGLVDEGRCENTATACTELTAEGVTGAVVAVIYQSLARHDVASGGQAPLIGLFPELLSLVLLPYLGQGAARREQARPAPVLPRAFHAGERPVPLGADPFAGLQMRVTYRTTKVLEGIGAHPSASNRTIADYAGIADQGQASKLLTRLERLGLLQNTGPGHTKGEPNAWQLTAKGQLVTDNLLKHSSHQRRAA